MTASNVAGPHLRAFLASRPGALVQVAVIALGVLALPGAALLSPVLLAIVAALLASLSGDRWRSLGFGRPTHRAFWWLSRAVVFGILWQYANTGIAGCIILASIVFGLGNWYQGDVGPFD